jgi:methylase of polypeptide subunit release factors
MLGFKIKRGVEASVERIFKATGSEFDKLTFNWSGQDRRRVVLKKKRGSHCTGHLSQHR